MAKKHQVVSKRGRSTEVRQGARLDERVIEIRLELSAPGCTQEEAANYIRAAVEGWKGSYSADEAAAAPRLLRMFTRAWVETER